MVIEQKMIYDINRSLTRALIVLSIVVSGMAGSMPETPEGIWQYLKRNNIQAP